MVGYRGVRSQKNGYWEGRDSYGKQHRKAGEKYKKKEIQTKEYIDVELITTRSD